MLRKYRVFSRGTTKKKRAPWNRPTAALASICLARKHSTPVPTHTEHETTTGPALFHPFPYRSRHQTEGNTTAVAGAAPDDTARNHREATWPATATAHQVERYGNAGRGNYTSNTICIHVYVRVPNSPHCKQLGGTSELAEAVRRTRRSWTRKTRKQHDMHTRIRVATGVHTAAKS